MNKLDLFKESIRNKEIAVIGIGISNIPLIKKLTEYGAKVCAFDKKKKDKLDKKIYNDLKNIGVTFSLGENYLDSLDHEIIFKTPGMRYDNPYLVKAVEKGSILTSEMEVFFDLCPCKIIGVTGSDGKTTTTTLIYQLLINEGYKCWLGGNIGKPLFSEIENIKNSDYVVVELSSFQLHTMKQSPSISVVTNVTPNHLDMHKSMEEYIEAKKNIFKNQSKNSKLILNYDNKITRSFKDEAIGECILFSRKETLKNGIFVDENYIKYRDGNGIEEILNVNDIALLGVHNVENYMAAIGAVIDKVSKETIINVAKAFKGVEHRIEFVKNINQISFFNDSIASSPTRTIAGLNAFKDEVILIAGGYDKKISYEKIGKVIDEKVKAVYLIGQTADKIEKAVLDYNPNTKTKIVKCQSLYQAVHNAYRGAKSGDTIILSPASASFDMFRSFEERGSMFKKIVKSL